MSFDHLSLAQPRSHIAGVVWPPVSTGKAATLAALLDELDRSQWLDTASIRTRQFRQLRVLADHSARHSPQFARRLGEAGLTPADFATPDGFARLPVLRRQDIQRAKDFFCRSIPPDHAPVDEARTSGSTGEPVCVRRTAVSQILWLGHMVRDELWHRRNLTARRCAIRTTAEEVIRFKSWGGIVGDLFETGEVLVIPSRLGIAEQIALIDEFRPDSLISYPNIIAALLDACVARGRGFEGLSYLRTLGEIVSPGLREEATRFFGARVADSYSSQELGYLTLECPDAPYHHIMAETVIVELLRDDGTPCEQGELGRVVVTDLHNLATPLIRYDLGDFAEAGPPCPCGRGLPTITRIVGRERNLLHLPDGRRDWPWFGRRNLRDAAPVSQFQIIQHDVERLEARLVCERPLTEREERDLKAAFAQALGHVFLMDFRYFDDSLPVAPNGKFEEFICLIGAEPVR